MTEKEIALKVLAELAEKGSDEQVRLSAAATLLQYTR